MIYENGDLKKVLFPGGYTEYTTMYAEQIHEPSNYYYNTDYIGNNRDVVDYNGAVVQRTEYSAFGTPFPNMVGDPGVQPYKYSGKEFDQMHGLNWYDFSARMYDPIFGRFNSIDPMAEKYFSISPYTYCMNNPVRFTDPTGMDAWSTSDPNEIANFFRQVSKGQKPDISSWDHQTDEDYLRKNSPNYFTYDSKNMMISVQWGSIENNEPVINCKRFPVGILKKKKKSYESTLFGVNSAIDKTTTLLDANIYGAQKLAGVATKDMVEFSALTVLGRITGGIGIYENLQKYQETDEKEYLYKAIGQAAAMGIGCFTGTEEIELFYNLGMLGYDIYEMKK